MFLRRKPVILSLLVISFLGYSSFIYINLPDNAKHAAEADNGKLVWQKYNCGSCHQVYGLGGFLGPDLTNVSSRRNDEYITALIRHGTNVMPSMGVSDKEIGELISYFKSLDSSGTADPRSFKIQTDGYIRQQVD